MSRLRFSLLASSVILLSNSARPEAEPQPSVQQQEEKSVGKDFYGDPLPKEAIARLGTVRFRHIGPAHSLAFAPNGKTLACAGNGGIYLWDAVTGRQLHHVSEDSWERAVLFTPDGKTLISGGTTIRLWNPVTGKIIRSFEGRPWVHALALSPDGTMLASGGADKMIRLWNMATGKQSWQSNAHQAEVRAIAYSPDGKWLASWGDDQVIRLWEVGTRREIHRLEKQEGNPLALAFTGDSKTLVSGSASEVIVWEVATGKRVTVSEQPIQWVGGFAWKERDRGRTERIALSPDARLVARGGYVEQVDVWQAATGKFINHTRQYDTPTALAFSSDGKTLAMAHHQNDINTIRLTDVTTGELLHFSESHQDMVSAVTFAAQGKLVATLSHDETARLWEAATGREVARLPVTPIPYITTLTASLDGKMVAILQEHEVLLCDGSTGKLVRRLRDADAWGISAYTFAFSPDSRLLVTPGFNEVLWVWDTATAKPLRRLGWLFSKPYQMLAAVGFTPDGRQVITVHAKPQDLATVVRVWDMATGKQLRRFGGWKAEAATISPNGKLLATAEQPFSAIRLWDVASGTEQMNLSLQPWSRAFVFSPDSRLLAVGGAESVCLWEVASGTIRRKLAGHTGDVRCLAFSPDRKQLVSGSTDTTALIWDLAGRGQAGPLPRVRLQARDLKQAWDDLKQPDASQADQAMSAMVTSPEDGVPFLQKNLLPVEPVDPLRVSRFVADLDSDQFEVRRAATQELENLAEIAESALRKALAEKPSLEVQQRIERLLDKLRLPIRSPEKLRLLRAIEILECIGTAEAQEVLKALAKGAPEALLTQEAKSALERLARRDAASAPNRSSHEGK
jgi:WD40 repeat protein